MFMSMFTYSYCIHVPIHLLYACATRAAFCQWGFRTFFYERIVEDKLGNFVDLCSVTNTSVFIMSNYSYGYYIHGRSVHGEADVGLRELVLQLEKEKDSLVGSRGLISGSEDQVFTIYVPSSLTLAIHRAYDEIGGGGAVAGTSRQYTVYVLY